MKDGDFVNCKKNFYTDSGQTKSILNIFKKPLFKKGNSYKIDKIEYIKLYNSNTGLTYKSTMNSGNTSVTTTSTTAAPSNSFSYDYINYYICGYCFPTQFISEYFYSVQEERKLKLKKIMEV